MDQDHIATCINEGCPVLILPKHCQGMLLCDISELYDVADKIYLNIRITLPDQDGVAFYSGCCFIKVEEPPKISEVDLPEKDKSNSFNINDLDINQMPIILAEASQSPYPFYNKSRVWIDPSRSPYVYNQYDSLSHDTYSIHEKANKITVQHHNTYITQNIHNYDHTSAQPHSLDRDLEQKEFITPPISNIQEELDFDKDVSDSDVCLSQIAQQNSVKKSKSLKKRFGKTEVVNGKNEALKQLMSTEIQSTSKQRKTILYSGKDSSSGQTIQNISYSDPKIQCCDIEVGHEVTIEDTPSPVPKKKKYQCDKCKTIFDRMSSFQQHMKRQHPKRNDNEFYQCSKCGKNIKSYQKYQIHCLGHGNPDVECPKCCKVYASNASLKTHLKIHNRQFQCEYCTRSYDLVKTYKCHLKKAHSKFMCEFEGCNFITDAESVLIRHLDDHTTNQYDYNNNDDQNDNHDQDSHNDGGNQNYQNDFNSGNGDDNNYEENQDSYGKYEGDDNNNNYSLSGHNNNDGQQIDDIDIDQIEHEFCIDKLSDIELVEPFSGFSDFDDLNFEKKLKSEELCRREKDADCKRIRDADSVIAKVISDKIFLANSKNAKKHARNNKSCQVCSKSFDRVSDLKRHLIEHVVKSTLAKAVSSAQGFLNVSCEICQTASFNSIDKYKAHLREHAKLTIYKCTFCDKSFSDSSNFSKHKKIHGISYFQCDLCSRKFNSKVMITRHMEYHNKTKPLSCKLCNRFFHFKSMLTKHMKSAHKATKVKFPCTFCGDVFNNLKTKWDHDWAVHNIRKAVVDCKLCDAKFRKYTELKKHCADVHLLKIRTKKKFNKKIYEYDEY